MKTDLILKAVLFDLDGTLVDTAPDLTYCLNLVRKDINLPPISLKTLRPHAAHGSKVMIDNGLSEITSPDEREKLRDQFLNYYQNNLSVKSKLFPGMTQVLTYLNQNNLAWGVVTNKSERFTFPLLAQLNLSPTNRCIVSGDTTPKMKPDPEPMLYACNILDIAAENCLYIGDAERDIIAGNNVNMKTMAALFGYIHSSENPYQWGADYYTETPIDIINFLKQMQ